jgi:hypothetical protein
LKALDPDRAFRASMDAFVAGVAELAKRPARTSAKAKTGASAQ